MKGAGRSLGVVIAATLCAVMACSSHKTVDTTASQLRFGVNMAEKGLWSEARERVGGSKTGQSDL